jgi:hypothetical protein
MRRCIRVRLLSKSLKMSMIPIQHSVPKSSKLLVHRQANQGWIDNVNSSDRFNPAYGGWEFDKNRCIGFSSLVILI